MRIGTAKTSRDMDRVCMEEFKIPGIVMMENAALKVIKNIDLHKYNSFVLICGKGNNGGDGFAIARHLHILCKNIEVFLIGDKEELSPDCRVNYDILINMGMRIKSINNIDDLDKLRCSINVSDVTIDCIFGTGLTRKVEGIYEKTISIVNENSTYIISVDVPSGMNSDSGEVLGVSIFAHKTICFQIHKRGFLKYDSDKITGKIIVENIGIPQEAVEKVCEKEFILEKELVQKSLKKRDKYSNKGDFGRAFIIAGSEGFTGAAYISTQAAVRSGAGLVTLACPKKVQDILSSKLVEAMTINIEKEDKIDEYLSKARVVAIGPGMGNNDMTCRMVKKVIREVNCPIVIDADGLNVLENDVSILREAKNSIVITPHPGEMSRLTGIDVKDINSNRIEVSKKFASKYGVVVLLKGYNTIIIDGNTTIINPTGSSAMANGGMGDCLTGFITSFIAQGYEPMEASYISAYLHGYCGDLLAEKMFCVNAQHMIDNITYIIKDIIL